MDETLEVVGTEALGDDSEESADTTARPYSRKKFGGREGGIGWTRTVLNGTNVRLVEGSAQFVLTLHPKYGTPGVLKWIVVRADTLEMCPADEERGWPSEHSELGTALREAVDRQKAWIALAIKMLGQANAEITTGQPQTLFERRGLENLRGGPRPKAQGDRSRKDRARLQAKHQTVKYPAPEQPALLPPDPSL